MTVYDNMKISKSDWKIGFDFYEGKIRSDVRLSIAKINVIISAIKNVLNRYDWMTFELLKQEVIG